MLVPQLQTRRAKYHIKTPIDIDKYSLTWFSALFRKLPEYSLKEKQQLPQHARYKLTLLKNPSHSIKPVKVKKRAADLFYLQTLYDQIKEFLPLMKLGHDGIRYYAKSVIKSDIFHLFRRSDESRYIHVIAFIAHQYYRLQDNLVDVLLSVMQSFRNSTSREYRDWYYDHREDRNLALKSLLCSLDDGVFGVLSDIQIVLKTPEISDAEKLGQIQALVNKNKVVMDKSTELRASIESRQEGQQYSKRLCRV